MERILGRISDKDELDHFVLTPGPELELESDLKENSRE